jgi:hypothetical protein
LQSLRRAISPLKTCRIKEQRASLVGNHIHMHTHAHTNKFECMRVVHTAPSNDTLSESSFSGTKK